MATYDVDVVVTDPILQPVTVNIVELSAAGMPSGGLTNQALTKASAADYDAGWEYVTGVPNGGANKYVLTKNSATDGDASWKAPGGFTFVQDTTPTPTKVGDTFFDMSTGVTGGSAYVAVDNGSGGLIWVQYAPAAMSGQYIPPIHVSTTTQFSTANVYGTPTAISPSLNSPTIYPRSTNSKFLISVSLMVGSAGCDDAAFFLLRNAVSIGHGAGGTNNAARYHRFNAADNLSVANISWEYLDSPNTVSPINYCPAMGVRVAGGSQVLYTNRRGADAVFATSSSITIQEIL